MIVDQTSGTNLKQPTELSTGKEPGPWSGVSVQRKATVVEESKGNRIYQGVKQKQKFWYYEINIS